MLVLMLVLMLVIMLILMLVNRESTRFDARRGSLRARYHLLTLC